MANKDTFGLRLRAARERRGITLQSIATRTKVSVSLWAALESSDLSRWPSGLFARSYIRDYARIVGLDVEETVDEFCRMFPNGDRRRGALVQGQAEVIDIKSGYRDEELPPEGDRRAKRNPVPAHVSVMANARVQRVFGAITDVAAVVSLALVFSALFRVEFLLPLGIVCVGYYAIGGALTGSTAGLKLAGVLGRRIPQLLHGAPAQRPATLQRAAR